MLALAVCLCVAGAQEPGPVLGISGTSFTLDGKPAFLLGASYYGALGIEDERAIAKDLDELAAFGFNWVRVWATWDAFDLDVSAVAPDGASRQPYMERLKRLCRMAGKRGMVVDVTVTRGERPGAPSGLVEHRAVLDTLARELAPFRNVYFDVGNERNIRDARHVPMDEVRALIEAVKRIDPGRLCTASHGGDLSADELVEYIDVGAVDFICPHRPRDPESASQTASRTRQYLDDMKRASRAVPVHYQEPFRRGYADWSPRAHDFLLDLEGARSGGAAGWCFHNGATRSANDGRPRRSFDMRASEGRLLEQLDEEEREFLGRKEGIQKSEYRMGNPEGNSRMPDRRALSRSCLPTPPF